MQRRIKLFCYAIVLMLAAGSLLSAGLWSLGILRG